MRTQPTRAQLQEAFKLAHLHSISLEQALTDRCLAIALANTALALEKARAKRNRAARIDVKRIAAGDND